MQDSDCDGDLECVSGNDDFGGCGLGSAVNVSIACSTRYYLYVTAGDNSSGGTFTLEAECNNNGNSNNI